MDSFVSARVPTEKKAQGNAILKSIGSTQTELVNAAYDYLLGTHELPTTKKPVTGRRSLSPEQLDILCGWIDQTTFPVLGEQLGHDGIDYKKTIAEGRLRDYEALS